MRETSIMVRVSDFQLEKLDEIVKYHESDRAKILRRGLFLLDKYNLEIKNFEDKGNKTNSIQIRLLEDDEILINKLEKKYNKKFTEIFRYGIYIQYPTIKELEKLEEEIILRD